MLGAAGASADPWSGYYIGLNAGYGMSQSDASRTITNNTYFAASSITALESASVMSLEEGTFTAARNSASIGIWVAS